jgi:hypothetical protein
MPARRFPFQNSGARPNAATSGIRLGALSVMRQRLAATARIKPPSEPCGDTFQQCEEGFGSWN